MLPLAAIIYGLLGAGALLWCWLAGRLPWPLYDPVVSNTTLLLQGLGAGLTLGLAVVLLSRVMVAHLRWVRALHQWFYQALGPLTGAQVLALAVLSSVGEELFFRGAMQPAWGIVPTTLLFTLLHFPSRLVLCSWTAMAGLLGLAFGYLTAWTGSIAGATLAHLLINALNLSHITRFGNCVPRAPAGRRNSDRPAVENLPRPDLAPSSVRENSERRSF